MARLDSAVRSYQSVPLRKRVLSVCRRGVMVMGASTRFLVDEYPIVKWRYSTCIDITACTEHVRNFAS